jgi:hypothetical protein
VKEHIPVSFLLFPFQFLVKSSSIVLLPLDIWFNHLIPDHPRVLFPLTFNSDALSILIISILSS